MFVTLPFCFYRFEDPNSIPDDYWHLLEASEDNILAVNSNDSPSYFYIYLLIHRLECTDRDLKSFMTCWG